MMQRGPDSEGVGEPPPNGVILRPEHIRARPAQVTAGPKDLTADTRDLPRKPRECRVRDGRDPRLLRRCRAQATWRPRVDPSGLQATVFAGFALSGPQDDTGEAGVSQHPLSHRRTSRGIVGFAHFRSRWFRRPVPVAALSPPCAPGGYFSKPS